MPTITVADHAGACYGVQRALELVQKVAQQATGPVHTLGPLIHNPQVVEGLAAHPWRRSAGGAGRARFRP